ncbi:ParB/RepB/Spo0J family partition protein [Aliarcobacter butzleri]|uniref:ParB/RepB/Spo0J family partition protein n=1 Tax=Aliarcobacter butzleri TaxID=28197 RepID=UPI00263DCEAE|nr:ParB/RepB/Spo0J family partition protein [Aliarcobacter butzleri]MDN5077617.1 ParB/RepB/Spo0J family partition protein [Aliarcobacter butzleri]MDN5118835.1 ParB/RepB/Spo0J family partition protein [Aliarcobacter butzleri]
MKPNLAEITKATAGKTKTSGISPFSELEISKVYPNPDQPRKAFEDIEELAATIKEHGLLQPITVVKKDDGYMIISGERRYKAHLFNETKTIKAYILDATDEEVQELTLIENIQRNDLTDFEIANHIVKLWKTGRYAKKSDLAKKVGKSESYVSKAFSSLNLDDEILEDIAVNKKDISISVMDEISRVKDKKVQKEVYQKYNAGEITRDNIKEFKEPKNKIEIKRKLLNTFIYNEPLRWEDGITLQSEFIDKNLPFENINTIGRGAYGNKGAFSFDDINACFCFHNIKIGDYIMRSDSNEKYTLTITKVEELEDNLLLENELSIIGEVHPESFSCLEFKEINAYFYYNNLKNPDYFQGFRKGEKYKLVIKKIRNKTEETNHTLKSFEDAEKDLVDQAKTFVEKFPVGNLEATFRVDDLVQDKTEILEAKSFKENFPWEKSYSEQYFYIEDFEKQLTQAFKDGYRQPFKKIKMNNAYEQKIHDLLLEQDTKYIDDCVDSINECVKRNGYKKEESGKIYLNAPGYHVRLRNRYGEIIFDLLKENLELKKELHNLKENQIVQDNSILEDKKEIALLELFSEAVTINYTNYDIDMGIDYQKAKKIIDKSKQESIPFNVGKGTDERVYRLINTDVRTIKDDCIVLIHN